jgi:hypothetical protein
MRTEQSDRQSNLREAGLKAPARWPRRKARPTARVQIAVAAAILSGIAAVGLVTTPAQASRQNVDSTSAVSTTQAGYMGYFTGNGVRIWSRPGRGTILGLGYRNQTFCADAWSGSYVHGKNRRTGVTGWVSKQYVYVHVALEC